MHDLPPERAPAVPGIGRIALALLPAPAGWLLQIGGSHLLGWSCGEAPLALHVLSALGAALALWAVLLSWRGLQGADAAWRGTGSSAAAQARFIALGTTVVSITVLALVLMTWASLFLSVSCV